MLVIPITFLTSHGRIARKSIMFIISAMKTLQEGAKFHVEVISSAFLPQRSRRESSMINQTTQMLSSEYITRILVGHRSPSSQVSFSLGSVSMQKRVVEITIARMDRVEITFARFELVGFSKRVHIFILVV